MCRYVLVLLLAAGAVAADARPDKAKLQEELLTLEKSGWEALKKQDRDAIAALTADDFVGIFSDGNRVSKADLLKLVPDFRVTEYTLEDVEVVVFNRDAAALTFKVTYESETKGEKSKSAVRSSSTWARRGGRWHNVFYQETPLKK